MSKNEGIPHKIKRFRRAKHMRIIIHHDGSVVVTGPMRVAKREIEKFVQDKKEWIEKGIEAFKNSPTPTVRAPSREEYMKYREDAREFVSGRVKYFAALYGFSYNRISIRNQKTCWGSCSSKRNLNFNYRLLFLPRHLADYIVVHELCHLREMNHSPRFWALVAEMMPNYKDLKRELCDMNFKIQ